MIAERILRKTNSNGFDLTTGQVKVQNHNLIQLLNHTGPLLIAGNTFERNSGFQAQVYIDQSSSSANQVDVPILILKNTFT